MRQWSYDSCCKCSPARQLEDGPVHCGCVWLCEGLLLLLFEMGITAWCCWQLGRLSHLMVINNSVLIMIQYVNYSHHINNSIIVMTKYVIDSLHVNNSVIIMTQYDMIHFILITHLS